MLVLDIGRIQTGHIMTNLIDKLKDILFSYTGSYLLIISLTTAAMLRIASGGAPGVGYIETIVSAIVIAYVVYTSQRDSNKNK